MAKIALLIGVSEYEPGLNPLPAAVKDVDAMKEVLLHPDMGGFTEQDIEVLKNPDHSKMAESIETLFTNRHKDDLVFLFFSGHGIKDDAGRLYLATRKTRKTPQGDLVRSSAVSANFVHENMSRSRSKRQIVILDSCFSGAFAEGLSAKDDGTVDIRTQLGGEGRAILTSSSSTQYSFEQEGEELSLYTRFLIEGIKTGAADQDGDDVVSIDELHEYASQKVREAKPGLKPEIYAIREGFKIKLCKVPQGDPQEKYKKEVARYGKRGELTIVSHRILDTWRLKLGLSVDEAKALEDEVLEPYRRDFQQRLWQYEQAVTEVLQRDGLIHDNTRQELQQLQQLLELRNEDTVPIEAKVTAHLKAHQQNLETYKQFFSEALRQKYPLGQVSRSRLQQMQQELKLSNADIEPIEAQITIEIETYQRNLQQYEQAFLTATQQNYPLSETERAELRQYQQSMGLSDVEIAPIEAKVTAQVETYHQKLRQYEEAFASATQRKHQPSEANRTQLTQTWQTLGLSEVDVKAIEAPILAQIEIYQANLRLYEQAFVDATKQEYPLSQVKQFELQQRQQALNLSDEDIEPIKSRITTSIEDHLKKLQQYEQVFSDSIKFEFPVSEVTREELRQFQQLLELQDDDVARIEEKIALQNKRSKNPIQHNKNFQPPEVDIQETTEPPNIPPPSNTVSPALQPQHHQEKFDQPQRAVSISIDPAPSSTQKAANAEKTTSSKKFRNLVFGISGIVISVVALPYFLGQATQARQSEAQEAIGTINRGQQAYYFEKGQFASDFSSLDLYLPETNYYSTIHAYNSGNIPYAISTATPKQDGLKGYVGGVAVDSNKGMYNSIVCESTQPSKSSPSSPQLVGNSFQCAPGSTEFKK